MQSEESNDLICKLSQTSLLTSTSDTTSALQTRSWTLVPLCFSYYLTSPQGWHLSYSSSCSHSLSFSLFHSPLLSRSISHPQLHIVCFSSSISFCQTVFVCTSLFSLALLRSPSFPLSFHLSEVFPPYCAPCLLSVYLFLPVYLSTTCRFLGEVDSLATDGGLLFISMATLEEKRAFVGESNSSLARESVLVMMLRPLLSSSTSATVSLRVLLGDMALDGESAWSSWHSVILEAEWGRTWTCPPPPCPLLCGLVAVAAMAAFPWPAPWWL